MAYSVRRLAGAAEGSPVTAEASLARPLMLITGSRGPGHRDAGEAQTDVRARRGDRRVEPVAGTGHRRRGQGEVGALQRGLRVEPACCTAGHRRRGAYELLGHEE